MSRATMARRLSEHDRAELEKFERYLLVSDAAGPERPKEAIYEAVYGEDETGPRDFRRRQ